MLEKEVKKLLKKHNIEWRDFLEFMFGQTIGIKNGKPDFYEWDVERFINNNK